MNDEHIPFVLLSDYHDDQISGPQKNRIEDHLSRCEECRKQYRSLTAMVQMVSMIGREEIRSCDAFVNDTMRKVLLAYKKRRRNLYLRVVPSAAAAVVILVIGAGFMRTGSRVEERKIAIMGPSPVDRHYAASGFREPNYRTADSYDNMTKTLAVLRRNRARILLISDSYIEGEIAAQGFDDIRRELRHSRLFSMNRTIGTAQRDELHMVGDSHLLFSDLLFQAKSSPQPPVRFRINLR